MMMTVEQQTEVSVSMILMTMVVIVTMMLLWDDSTVLEVLLRKQLEKEHVALVVVMGTIVESDRW